MNEAKLIRDGLFAVLVGLLSGCASQPPAWIMTPEQEVDGGFAATDCVKKSGNLSLERQMAVARARAEISKQIELRVAAMDKTFARVSESAEQKGDREAKTENTRATAFESVSKQISEQTLSGLTPQRVEYVELDGAENLCAMVVLDQERARKVYEQILAKSGARVDATTDAALYGEFSGQDQKD